MNAPHIVKYTEYIDGIRVVYISDNKSSFVEMYDENNNKFDSNANSIEEAKKRIAYLAEIGINATIGPRGPWIDEENKKK